MKTKSVVTVLTLMLAVVFSAPCSGQNDGTETLIVAGRGGTHIDGMNAVKAQFEEEYGVKVEILALESADLKQKISLNAGSKTGSYSLIMADDTWMPEFCDADLFTNLEELGVKGDSDFIEAALNLGKFPYATGDLYALPIVGNVQLFFYNKGLFDAQGLTAPESWEEVLEAATAIRSATGKDGYLIRGQQGNPIVSDFLPVLWAMGGSVFTGDWMANVNNDLTKEALSLYIDLLNQGNNLEKNELVEAVSAGNAGMSLGWPSWYISGETSSAAFAPIPTRYNGGSNPAGMIGNWMIGIPANAPDKELAAKFLEFITSSEIQKEMALHGGVPSRKSVYEDPELVARYPHFPAQMSALENSVARPRTPLWSDVENVFGAELSAAVSGLKSIDQALADSEAAINRIMN